MTPIENLHYALGELAFAMARADGKVQAEEKKKFQELIVSELSKGGYNFDISDIIFKLMEKQEGTTRTIYDWAMNTIRQNSHYLSPRMKEKFIDVMEKMAHAYAPVTIAEESVLERFKKDIAPLKGDPIYYGNQ